MPRGIVFYGFIRASPALPRRISRDPARQTLNLNRVSTIGSTSRSESQKPMEEIMCDYSLEHYRSRPAQLGEKYETHQFGSWSIGFIAPGDASTAICMACDTKLRLRGSLPSWAQGEGMVIGRHTFYSPVEAATGMGQASLTFVLMQLALLSC